MCSQVGLRATWKDRCPGTSQVVCGKPSVTNYLPHKFSPNGSLFKKLVWLGFLFSWADRGSTEPTRNLLVRKPSTGLTAFRCSCGPLGPFCLVGRVESSWSGWDQASRRGSEGLFPGPRELVEQRTRGCLCLHHSVITATLPTLPMDSPPFCLTFLRNQPGVSTQGLGLCTSELVAVGARGWSSWVGRCGLFSLLFYRQNAPRSKGPQCAESASEAFWLRVLLAPNR